MIYLLIDNCSLRALIDINGYSERLQELENLIASKQVSFITHQLILEEWKKHKESWGKKKGQKLIGYPNRKQHSANEANALLPSPQFIQNNHIHAQINKIDELLSNAFVLETPPIISNEFSGRYRARLAPFHKKQQSQNDWEIIGSFCNYCEIRGIGELTFISANSNDFADIEDIDSIHRDFKSRFSKVVINYFRDYTKFFEKIQSLSELSNELIRYTIVPNVKFSYQATIRKNVLDSLCHIYRNLYQEIEFIPVHILRKLYPFATSDESHVSYNAFTMSYVSEELVEFFSNIEVKENKIYIKDETLVASIHDYREKIEYILKKLTYNLIYHVTGKKVIKKYVHIFFKILNATVFAAC